MSTEEKLSAEDQTSREKGLALVARMEHLAQTDERFRQWLQVGIDQIEAGQVVEIDMSTAPDPGAQNTVARVSEQRNTSSLIEQLADKEHASWARWMNYIFDVGKTNEDGSFTIPAEYVTRWLRQANTRYAELSEREKQSDRDEVMHILPIIQERRNQ